MRFLCARSRSNAVLLSCEAGRTLRASELQEAPNLNRLRRIHSHVLPVHHSASLSALRQACSMSTERKYVSDLDPSRVALLEKNGIKLTALEPLGARVTGLDLRGPEPSEDILQALQGEMATRGFLVFEGQGVLTGDEQCRASAFW